MVEGSNSSASTMVVTESVRVPKRRPMAGDAGGSADPPEVIRV